MEKLLTQAQVDAYHRDGYLFPIRAFSATEGQRDRNALEDYEARIGTKLTSAGKYRSRTYLLFRWAQELVRHPRILDAVEDILGPNILGLLKDRTGGYEAGMFALSAGLVCSIILLFVLKRVMAARA